jgi:hypothetical protein
MRKLLPIAVALLWSAGAQAQALKGEYGFTGSSVCFTTLAEFNAAFVPLGPGSVSNFVQTGTYVFNADGTGTVISNSMNITFSTTAVSGGASQSKATFSYTVVGDVLTIVGGGTLSGTSTAGPRAGQTFVVTSLSTLTGWTSRGSGIGSLTLTTLAPVVEIITYSGAPAGQTGPYNRICGVQRTLVPLP